MGCKFMKMVDTRLCCTKGKPLSKSDLERELKKPNVIAVITFSKLPGCLALRKYKFCKKKVHP